MNKPTSGYAGVVSRGVALGIDAAMINVIAILLGAAISAILSLFGDKDGFDLGAVLAGAFAWGLWAGVYFVSFWTFVGQTPGDRLLGIHVIGPRGDMEIGRAIRRYIGLVLCLLPFGLGFVPVLFDDRRRGLHDRFANTVVRWGDLSAPETITLAERPQIPPAPTSANAGT
jgi:uncharacterized RDD family membrane protein YckC